MQSLSTIDLNYVVRRIPSDIRRIMKETSTFVGGGFIRETIAGNAPHDIDLFGPDKLGLKMLATTLAAQRNVKCHETDNALTVLAPPRMPVQFITRWLFSDPAKLIESFDFTVCQATVWFGNGQFHSAISDRFYPDLAARRLMYTYPQREEEAGGSMMRVLKFLKRGYNIQAPSLGGVMSRMEAKVVEAHLPLGRFEGNREKAVGHVFAGLLREVDPLLAVDGLNLISEHEEQEAP